MKDKLKKSSHPVMFFIYMSIFAIIVSGIASALNFQVTYDKLTTIAGEVEKTTVAVNSLFSLDGIKYLVTSAYSNLNSFIPFTALLIGAIAYGIASKSGFFKTLFSRINKRIPKGIVVFLYSLICITLSISGNTAYILLLPIGAVLFMSMSRNPIGGLALGFASIASGHGAGLFVNSLDYNLISTTEASAKLISSNYTVGELSNLIYIIVAALLIAFICTIVCEKFMVRKLGRNQITEEEEFVIEESKENKGLIGALIATIIYIIPIIIMIIPSKGSGFVGLLLDKSQTGYFNMIFSEEALFMSNLASLIALLVAVQGFVYGVVSGTIRKIRDMVNFSTDYLKSIGGIFVLVFFAAQFYGIVNQTNLGTVIAGSFANIISYSDFSFIVLVLMLLLFVAITNIIMPSSIDKWVIFAPTVVPAMMKANVTPEFAQAIFRAGDSITNTITPVFIYFVIFIGFIELFTKNKNEFSIKGCYRVILPYFGTILLVWLLIIIGWYIIGLPIGPGIYPTI